MTRTLTSVDVAMRRSVLPPEERDGALFAEKLLAGHMTPQEIEHLVLLARFDWAMCLQIRPFLDALIRGLGAVFRDRAWTRIVALAEPVSESLPSAPDRRPCLVPRGPNAYVTHGAPIPGLARSDVAA